MIKAKKSLGQNFLVDQNIISKIIDIVNIKDKNILEIGPGTGKINENSLNNQILTVFGNLPYNISTEILSKWILNINPKKVWFNCLVLMFQKEVADRIISKFNTKEYGRLTILANWRLNIKKIMDIKPNSFQPKPKIESTVYFCVNQIFYSQITFFKIIINYYIIIIYPMKYISLKLFHSFFSYKFILHVSIRKSTK